MVVNRIIATALLLVGLLGSSVLAGNDNEFESIQTEVVSVRSVGMGGVVVDAAQSTDGTFSRPAMLGMADRWSFSWAFSGKNGEGTNAYGNLTSANPDWLKGGNFGIGMHYSKAGKLLSFRNAGVSNTIISLREAVVGFGIPIGSRLFAGIGFTLQDLTRLDVWPERTHLTSSQVRGSLYSRVGPLMGGLDYQHTFNADQFMAPDRTRFSDELRLSLSGKLEFADGARTLSFGVEELVANDVDNDLSSEWSLGGEFTSEVAGPISIALRAGYTDGDDIVGAESYGAGIILEALGATTHIDWAHSSGQSFMESGQSIQISIRVPHERLKRLFAKRIPCPEKPIILYRPISDDKRDSIVRVTADSVVSAARESIIEDYKHEAFSEKYPLIPKTLRDSIVTASADSVVSAAKDSVIAKYRKEEYIARNQKYADMIKDSLYDSAKARGHELLPFADKTTGAADEIISRLAELDLRLAVIDSIRIAHTLDSALSSARKVHESELKTLKDKLKNERQQIVGAMVKEARDLIALDMFCEAGYLLKKALTFDYDETELERLLDSIEVSIETCFVAELLFVKTYVADGDTVEAKRHLEQARRCLDIIRDRVTPSHLQELEGELEKARQSCAQ